MVCPSASGQVYPLSGGADRGECPAAFLHVRNDGERCDFIPGGLRVSAHKRRHCPGAHHAHCVRVLDVCADGAPSGASLEYDSRHDAKKVRAGASLFYGIHRDHGIVCFSGPLWREGAAADERPKKGTERKSIEVRFYRCGGRLMAAVFLLRNRVFRLIILPPIPHGI